MILNLVLLCLHTHAYIIIFIDDVVKDDPKSERLLIPLEQLSFEERKLTNFVIFPPLDYFLKIFLKECDSFLQQLSKDLGGNIVSSFPLQGSSWEISPEIIIHTLEIVI